MAAKIPFLKARQKLVDKKDKALERRLKSFQDGLVDALYIYAASRLATEAGKVLSNADNLSIISNLDDVFLQYMNGSQGQGFVGALIDDVSDIADVNEQYYEAQTDDSNFSNYFNDAKNYMYTYLGIEVTSRALKKGSQIYDALYSTDWLKYIKASIIDSIDNSGTLRSLRRSFKTVGADRYFKQFQRNVPNLGYRAESILGKKTAVKIGMDFAFYQGGLIETSRDFCKHRNNQVYHVSEIAKFGTPADTVPGYTNKSQGYFQGKTDPYDPFVDVGGYNCRHRYFYISNELGLSLRPDLQGQDLPIPSEWRGAA